MLEAYLATISTPMHRAKAKAALTQLTRHNGSVRIYKRHELIAEKLKSGAKVVDHKGKMVLMSPNGAWLDTRNITKHGLNFAAWLSVQR